MRLKQLRQDAGLTMKKLGAKLGVAESTVSLYESGKRTPDVETVKRIAEYFNVSVDYLLGLTDEKEGPLAEISEGTLNDELISRVLALSPEDRLKVDIFVQGIEAARGGTASQPAEGRK